MGGAAFHRSQAQGNVALPSQAETVMSVDTVWSERQRELWQRLEAHDFGTTGCALTFERRLAREHGWNDAYALGAIREYKRFCFLATVAGHTVTPSDAVDEVWHQHLTYSRDYWQHFCPDVLGTPLHHEPTRGGRDQSRLHYAQYAETLASYQRWFGPPPVDYWPDARTQTANPARYRRVDVARHWMLPRPAWRRLSWRRIAVAAVLLPIAPLLQALPPNPLDFDGPTFLALYIGLAAVCAGIVVWARRQFGGNPGHPQDTSLDTWSAAYLAGGAERVVDAGIATLLASGQARWDTKQRRLEVTGRPQAGGYPLDDIARAAAVEKRTPRIARRLGRQLQRIRDPLLARKLLLDARSRWLMGLCSAVPFALLTGLGVMKILVGLQRDRPVGFLVLLTLLTGIAALVLLAWRPERSRAGDAVLRAMNHRHAHARRAPRDGDIGLAVALAGTAVLAGTAYAGFHESRASSGGGTSSTDSSDGSCSSSDGGSSCSSGCGGCGGGGD